MTNLADELERLAKEATPGEWRTGDLDHNRQRIVQAEHIEVATFWHHCVGSIEPQMEANAALIVAIRNALPEIISALRREEWQGIETARDGMLAWAVSRWDDEVKHRPIQNKNRRALDDVWRQVIRRLGGNPDKLLSLPPHDDLASPSPSPERN